MKTESAATEVLAKAAKSENGPIANSAEFTADNSAADQSDPASACKRIHMPREEFEFSGDTHFPCLANRDVVVRDTSKNFWKPFQLGLDAVNVSLSDLQARSLVLMGNYRQFRINNSPNVAELTLAKGRFEGLDLSRLRTRSLKVFLDASEFGWIKLPHCLQVVTLYSVVINYNLAHRAADLVNFTLSDVEGALEAWTNPAKRTQLVDWLLYSARPRINQSRQNLIRNSSGRSALGVLNQKTIPTRPQLLLAGLLVARPNFQKRLTKLETQITETEQHHEK